jgi:hypothetical protein
LLTLARAGNGAATGVLAVASHIAERAPRVADLGALETVQLCVDAFGNSSWPGVAWRFSRLSTDGSPLQFTFATHDDALRYASEVAGPEIDDRLRLRAACELAGRAGTPVPVARLHEWETMQSGHELRWGAWAGARHDGGAPSVKLYVEIPRSLRERGQPNLRRIVPSSQPMMIGYDCVRGSEEHYFRQPAMGERDRGAFLAYVAGARRRQAVLEAFAELCDMPARTAVTWVNFGYSLGPGADPAFAMFVRSRSLRSVARVRRIFLTAQERVGRTQSAYRDLLGSLSEERLPDHEIVSVVERSDRDAELRVGIGALALLSNEQRLTTNRDREDTSTWISSYTGTRLTPRSTSGRR